MSLASFSASSAAYSSARWLVWPGIVDEQDPVEIAVLVEEDADAGLRPGVSVAAAGSVHGDHDSVGVGDVLVVAAHVAEAVAGVFAGVWAGHEGPGLVVHDGSAAAAVLARVEGPSVVVEAVCAAVIVLGVVEVAVDWHVDHGVVDRRRSSR